jgi:hypothetical protein
MNKWMREISTMPILARIAIEVAGGVGVKRIRCEMGA